MIPYEPFGVNSGFSEWNSNNGVVFNQILPPTNGNYTHVKLYSTGSNASRFSGYLGVAIYTHIDVESDNSTTENGYPNELISSGVIFINNSDVGHKYHTISFDKPIPVETDKLYWIAIATTITSNQFMKILKDHQEEQTVQYTRHLD